MTDETQTNGETDAQTTSAPSGGRISSVHRMLDTGEGGGLFAVEFDEQEFADSYRGKLATEKAQPENNGSTTPTGSADDRTRRLSDEVGPVLRAPTTMAHLGMNGLDLIGKSNYELSKAINRQADEIFRKDFPVVEPTVSDPSEEQRERIESFVRDVNDAGQTLHGLLKTVLMDHARLGTGMLVVRKTYGTMDGEVIEASIDEIVRGNPKRIRPVTDAHNRIGGLYACPVHRDEISEDPAVCATCGCDLREVTYARTESPRSDTIDDPFFDDEIISFSFYNTMLEGRDGLPPTAGVWKQALILDYMRDYVGQFYDDDSGDKYPNKLMFVTTSNADAFEKQANQAKDNRQDNPYETGALFFENMDVEVEVVDMMSDKLMGQSEAIKERYKSDIRTAFGLTDIVDSDENSSALASGTKAVSVMSRSIQALQTDIEREVLTELEDALGITDYELTFRPEVEDEEKMSVKEQAEAIQALTEAGQDYRITDEGDVELVPTDEQLDSEATASAPPASDDGATDSSNEVTGQ